MLQMLSQASLFALFSLFVGILPLGFGIRYAVRPTEARLAMMRPISLAGIFAGLSGTVSGFINVLSHVWRTDPPSMSIMAVGAAEALVTLLVAFGSLTVAWLCVAVGLRRQV